MKILSSSILNEDFDAITYNMIISLKPEERKDPKQAIENHFFRQCSCSYDCCGCFSWTPWTHTVKRLKRREYSFKYYKARNI